MLSRLGLALVDDTLKHIQDRITITDRLLNNLHVAKSLDDNFLSTLLSPGRPLMVSYLNQHSINLAFEDAAFASAMMCSDIIFRDGVGLEMLLRCVGREPGLNCNGTDLIPHLLRLSGSRRVSLFGTSEPWISRASARIEDEGVNVVSHEDGFRENDYYLKMIVETSPDVVVLGMGMPRQEVLAQYIKRHYRKEILIVCGGAILDFYANRFPRAPKILRTLKLEWMYRMAKEPRRLMKRYTVGGALFAFRCLVLAISSRQLDESDFCEQS